MAITEAEKKDVGEKTQAYRVRGSDTYYLHAVILHLPRFLEVAEANGQDLEIVVNYIPRTSK